MQNKRMIEIIQKLIFGSLTIYVIKEIKLRCALVISLITDKRLGTIKPNIL